MCGPVAAFACPRQEPGRPHRGGAGARLPRGARARDPCDRTPRPVPSGGQPHALRCQRGAARGHGAPLRRLAAAGGAGKTSGRRPLAGPSAAGRGPGRRHRRAGGPGQTQSRGTAGVPAPGPGRGRRPAVRAPACRHGRARGRARIAAGDHRRRRCPRLRRCRAGGGPPRRGLAPACGHRRREPLCAPAFGAGYRSPGARQFLVFSHVGGAHAAARPVRRSVQPAS